MRAFPVSKVLPVSREWVQRVVKAKEALMVNLEMRGYLETRVIVAHLDTAPTAENLGIWVHLDCPEKGALLDYLVRTVHPAIVGLPARMV